MPKLEEKITLEIEKNQLINKRNDFHRALMAKYPKYAELSDVHIVGAKEGAKYLPKDAVLINYIVQKNEVLVFTLQADGTLTAHDLGPIPHIETNIKNYRQYIKHYRKDLPSSKSEKKVVRIKRFGKTPRQKFEALSKKLAKQLLEPLYEIIKDKPRWIISPSGALASIPFETLRLNDQFVIAQHQISYVQSLSVLAFLQKRDQVYKSLENRGTLLAMGAPLYENTTITASTPTTIDYNIARQMVMRGDDYVRAFEQLGQPWRNLPGASVELEQLEALFKDTKPLIYKQENATEAKLQSLNQQGILAQYRYLVFSAHGYLSPKIPALSSIVLGQINNPKGIDGYVTASEWPGYDLKSDLMVLSACETGLCAVVGDLVRTKGSHRQYKHEIKKGLVTVPGKPSEELAPGTLNSILKQAGLKP